MPENEPLTIVVGDHLFRVRAAEPEQRERFTRAENEANARLGEIIKAGGMSGPRALGMLAFELCVELDELRRDVQHLPHTTQRIEQMIQKIDAITASE